MTAGPDRRRLHAVVAAVSLAALLAVLSAALVPPLPSAAAPVGSSRPAPAPAESPAAPGIASGGELVVELTAMTPSALDPGEPLELQGVITNGSDQVWRAVQAFLVISPSPLSTRPELAAEAASPAESYFGDRITNFGSFARLGGLVPGEVAPVRLTVPWRQLEPRVSGAEGVYTVGIQVRATDVDRTRSTVARARTFVPLVDPATPTTVRLALVWPLDAAVLRRADGTYANSRKLVRALAPGGQLRRMLDLGRTSGSVPLTVVPDPALLSAARDLGSGRFGPPGGTIDRVPTDGSGPIQPTGPTDDGPGEPAPSDGATPASPGGTGAPPEDDGDSASGGSDEASTPEAVPAAASWLTSTVELTERGTAWSTLYAEPSADTLARSARARVDSSVALATRAAQRRLLGSPARILSLPTGGVVGPDTLAWLRTADGSGDGTATTALAPRMLPEWEPLDGSAVTVPTDAGPASVVLADPALAGGGPLPGDPLAALQVRQRLLAETALLGLEAAAVGQSGLDATFVAPEGWDPGSDWPAARFFSGLEVPWLDPVPLDDQLAAARPYVGPVGVEVDLEAGEVGGVASRLLPDETVDTAARLDRQAGLLVELVGGGRPLRRWYDSAVALGVSGADLRAADTHQLLLRTVQDTSGALRGVSVSGPDFVALSSSRGRFPLTVTNSLDRSVTVSVSVEVPGAAQPGTRTRFDAGDLLTVGPGQRDTVTVETQLSGSGVRSARAYLVTADGRRFGTPLSFSLRTSIVGTVIWGVLGLACAVLVLAIVRRVMHRVRGRSTGKAGDAVGDRTTAGATP